VALRRNHGGRRTVSARRTTDDEVNGSGPHVSSFNNPLVLAESWLVRELSAPLAASRAETLEMQKKRKK